MKSPYTYRNHFNANCNQVGKFVTIYPKDDQEAKWIVEELNKKFVEKGFNENCFLNIKEDFKVYPGIYVRMSEYSGKLDDDVARERMCIPNEVFQKHCESMNIETKNYEHPFEKLYECDIEMPKKVCQINNKLKKIYKE